jgi:hypothetical protein
MATIESPLQRWWAACVALCRGATTEVIDRTAAPSRIYVTSGLDALIAAAAPGEELAPAATREMFEEMAALWGAFSVWAAAPIDDPRAHGKSPLQILSELGGA